MLTFFLIPWIIIISTVNDASFNPFNAEFFLTFFRFSAVRLRTLAPALASNLLN